MATVTKKLCDFCEKDDNTVRSVYINAARSWELDICDPCWGTVFDTILVKARHTTSKRPAARFTKTKLPPQP
jgi:hypothetical protein